MASGGPRRPARSSGVAALALLAEATRAVVGTLDLGRLLPRLIELTRSHLAADAAGVWLLERPEGELVLCEEVGLRRASSVARLARSPGRDVMGWIVDRPGPVRLHGLPAAARPEARAWIESEQFRSFLGLPLVGDAAAVGMLGLFRRGRRPFTAADLARAEALCVPAGPAIANARLYAEQLERAERTEVLLATAEALGGTLDLPAALDDVSRRAAHALAAERCTIALWPGGVPPADAPREEAEAARTGRPVEIDDTVLVVPVVRQGEAIGVLRLTARRRRPWVRSAVELASAIAAQIALIADNAPLYREAQARAGELAVLHEVGTTLTSTLDLPTVLDAVVDAAVRLSGAQQCAVLELDPTDQRLWVRAQRGFDENWPKISLALGQGAGGIAAQTRGPFFVADLERAPLPMEEAEGRPGLSLREVVRRDGRRAVLAVPLISKETVLGAITVFWLTPRLSGGREVRLLSGLAQQAAVAIEQARLHGASLRRAEELAALLRAVRTMLAGLDTKIILDTIVQEASAISGTMHVTLFLLDRASGALRVAALVGSPMPDEPAAPPAGGHSAEVAATGQLVVDDTYLGLPVKIRETVLGVLSFTTTAPRRYSAEELAYLGSFADHAAIALDNARLYDDAQRALGDMRIMQRRLVQGETLRALGELASGAAHHLNNLLTIVVGRIQLLRRNVREERVLRALEIVERAAKDGAEVVRRLQQFAGMRRTMEPRTVDLNRIVREVLEMSRGRWQESARAHDIEIAVEARLTPVPAVPGDPASLRELLTNLVFNAIEAMPQGGRLVVETGALAHAVTLAVIDTGLGMPEEVRLRAHEPFFTTKGVKSTGLGLSVAFGITRRHGGELAIQSAPGQGTTVRVTLPVPAGTAPPPAIPPPLPHRPLRILLVDDEEEVRRALAEMLVTQGHNVIPAGSGADAVRRLATDVAVDLVLTDLMMPGMSGWELAAEVKRQRPLLPVGVITGWGDVPEPSPAMEAAVDFVLSKPVTLDALDDTVGRLARREL